MATKSATGRVGVRVRGPVLEQPVAHNLEVVGFSDMDGKRDGLQMDYQEVGGRHYLYVGHFWSGGVSILDVTDPSQPRVAGFVPTLNDATWHIKVQVAEQLMLVPCELNFFAPPGVDASQAKSGVRLFDVSNPTEPDELAYYAAGGIGVHRSWWNGGQYAYLSAGTAAPGIWMHGVPDMTRILTILDVSDPRNPQNVSDFWLPEQRGEDPKPGEGETLYVHEPVVEGDRAYVAYWDGGFAILDISDKTKPAADHARADVPGALRRQHAHLRPPPGAEPARRRRGEHGELRRRRAEEDLDLRHLRRGEAGGRLAAADSDARAARSRTRPTSSAASASARTASTRTTSTTSARSTRSTRPTATPAFASSTSPMRAIRASRRSSCRPDPGGDRRSASVRPRVRHLPRRLEDGLHPGSGRRSARLHLPVRDERRDLDRQGEVGGDRRVLRSHGLRELTDDGGLEA